MARPKADILKSLKNSLPLKGKLLIAVSGGKDSIALLHACNNLKEKMRLKLGVVHVDHSLRKNSKADAAFVKKTSENLGLECFSRKIRKTDKKINTEDWGRQERYKFFSEVRKEKNFDWVLTAHTANDVAETFLIRLLQNKELNSIEAVDFERKLMRPLLNVSTKEIYSYIKNNKIKYVEDETNKEDFYLRNKIRNKLLPFLEKFDKRISETLRERAMSISEDIKGLNFLFEEPVASISRYTFGKKDWLREVRKNLKAFPDVLNWRLAELLLKPMLGFNLGRTKSKELVRLLKGEIQGVQLPNGLNLRLSDGGLGVYKRFNPHGT